MKIVELELVEQGHLHLVLLWLSFFHVLVCLSVLFLVHFARIKENNIDQNHRHISITSRTKLDLNRVFMQNQFGYINTGTTRTNDTIVFYYQWIERQKNVTVNNIEVLSDLGFAIDVRSIRSRSCSSYFRIFDSLTNGNKTFFHCLIIAIIIRFQTFFSVSSRIQKNNREYSREK